MDEDEGLPAPRWTHDDPVASVILPGKGFLVMIEHLKAITLFATALLPCPRRKVNPDYWEKDVLKMLKLIAADLTREYWRKHLLEGLQEALSRSITANIRLRMQVVPEEHLRLDQ